GVAVGAGGPVRDRHVRAPHHGVAGVGGAGVAVVAARRRAGDAGARAAGLEPVAGVPVGAGGPVRDRRVGASGHRVAGVGGAGVAVVAARRRAGDAAARLPGALPIAGVPVGAGGPVRERRVGAAGHRVAGVGGAGVA